MSIDLNACRTTRNEPERCAITRRHEDAGKERESIVNVFTNMFMPELKYGSSR